MSIPEPIDLGIPLVRLNSPSQSSIAVQDITELVASPASSSPSNLTSSDKLSALPPSSPYLGRVRSLNRSQGQSHSLPSLDHSTPQFGLSTVPRTSVSDGSLGKETHKQRTSAESDRISLPTIQSVRQAFSRLHGSSAGAHSSHSTPDHKNGADSPDSRSHSRAASPLRIFQRLRGHQREEPFVPIDPFQPHFRLPCFTHSTEHADSVCNCNETLLCCFSPPLKVQNFLVTTQFFVAYTLPRTIYLHFLLRLPSLYFTRVARIFQDAEVSKPDIQRMIDMCLDDPEVAGTSEGAGTFGLNPGVAPNSPTPPSHTILLPFPEEWNAPVVSPALVRFKHSWETFIDSLLREWKTLNLVSALLLSAILTMFQIPSATDDPLIRTAAFLSLICALMSLSYGCIYIVRFGTMRSMYKASRWAEESRKTNTLIWWNVWVLLAMPAVWLAWSMLLFVTSILSLVWRTGSTADPPTRSPLAPRAALGPRIAVTCVFVLGMVYFGMIIVTLARYGSTSGERGRESRIANGAPAGAGRERELEAVMESRGRRREPAVTGSTRREEPAERQDGDEKDGRRKEKEKGGTGLRPVMGLGLTGMGELGGGEADSDKGVVREAGKGSSSR